MIDLLFDFFKELINGLPLGQLLMVGGAVVIFSLFVGSKLSKAKGRKDGLWGVLFGKSDEEIAIEHLAEKVDAFVTLSATNTADVKQSFNSLATKLTDLTDQATNQHRVVEASHQEILDAISERYDSAHENLGKMADDLDKMADYLKELSNDIERQIESVRQDLKMHDVQEMQLFENQKAVLSDALDKVIIVQKQLEKIDEFVKIAVPEFKQSHRDISRDITDLRRDIALIERSLQTQIHTVANVKLRQ